MNHIIKQKHHLIAQICKNNGKPAAIKYVMNTFDKSLYDASEIVREAIQKEEDETDEDDQISGWINAALHSKI